MNTTMTIVISMQRFIHWHTCFCYFYLSLISDLFSIENRLGFQRVAETISSRCLSLKLSFYRPHTREWSLLYWQEKWSSKECKQKKRNWESKGGETGGYNGDILEIIHVTSIRILICTMVLVCTMVPDALYDFFMVVKTCIF